MIKNLILQGLQPDTTIINKIAAHTNAQNIICINPQTYRCENVQDTPSIAADIDSICFNAQLDYAYIEHNRSLADFKLIAMDMDSTLITIECIDEIADMLNLKPQVSEITEAAMRGELNFSESLTKRVALLKDLPEAALEQVFNERVKFSPGALTMLTAVKKAGLKTLLVSGGFTYFTNRIKTQLGLDFAHANTLEIKDGKLTGKLIGTIVDATIKKQTVQDICQKLAITPTQTIVMGDGANDLEMMSIAGLSVAFRAKPIVRKQANVALNFVGLDGVLALLS